MNESINDKGIFKAIFMAGTPGAGKTTVSKKLSGGVEPRVVSTDTWVNFMKAFGKEGWEQFGEKIKILSEAQLTNYLNSMLPLWIDSTSSKPANVKLRRGIIESIGYDTAMIWVNTDIDTAIERAKAREKRTGRIVDPDFIVDVHEKINRNKIGYKNSFDTFIEVNNNDGELTDKIMNRFYAISNNFFTSNIQNGDGLKHKHDLQDMGGKYLVDLPSYDMARLKRLSRMWFI